jgi:hypothetical protein
MNFNIDLALASASPLGASGPIFLATRPESPVLHYFVVPSAYTTPRIAPTDILQFDASRNLKKAVVVQPCDIDVQGGSASFSRLQFRNATGNNGKPNQVQERFQLVVGIYAKLVDGEVLEVGRWTSENLIVRGRSPKNFTSSKKLGGVKRNRDESGEKEENDWETGTWQCEDGVRRSVRPRLNKSSYRVDSSSDEN